MLLLFRLRVVSNFGDGDCGAGEIHTRAPKFEETRIAIAKIRDYSQSIIIFSYDLHVTLRVTDRFETSVGELCQIKPHFISLIRLVTLSL